MSERTFRGKKHEERVSAALDKGRAVAEANVGKALYTKAVKGDITAIRWWETTRVGRSERQIIRYEWVRTKERSLLLKAWAGEHIFNVSYCDAHLVIKPIPHDRGGYIGVHKLIPEHVSERPKRGKQEHRDDS